MTTKKLGKVQLWGIAAVNGELELLRTRNRRTDIRELKREVYPGGEFRIVRVEAALTSYNK